MNPDDQQQHVSTEPQRLALEAMSAQLIHKLNAMIREQEDRARKFAEQHHSTLPVPQPVNPQPVSNYFPPREERPETRPATQRAAEIPAPQYTRVTPPPLATRRKAQQEWESEPDFEPSPRLKLQQASPRKKTATEKEEGNIGVGMIIFALVGIIMLLRSCS